MPDRPLGSMPGVAQPCQHYSITPIAETEGQPWQVLDDRYPWLSGLVVRVGFGCCAICGTPLAQVGVWNPGLDEEPTLFSEPVPLTLDESGWVR